MVTFDELSTIALGLPETTQRPAWGIPCFRVRDKIFAAYREEWHAVACRVSPEEKAALPQEDPGTFSVPAHYRNAPMVVVALAYVDPQYLRELLTEAWRLCAPERLRAAYDSATTPSPDD